jgi:hypothetical protein
MAKSRHDFGARGDGEHITNLMKIVFGKWH